MLIAGCLLITVLSMSPEPAFAQGASDGAGIVEATEEQVRLNDQGVRAISEEDYVKAISLLEEAKYLGELNITYLNLGRAYQLAGRCQKAREALEKVASAPKVEKPPPGLVESKAREYLGVLSETCTEAQTSEETETTPSRSTKAAGIVITSAGGVLLASAAGMHFVWAEGIRDQATSGLATDEVVTSTTQREFYEERDRANTIDSVALGTAVAGGIATGLGLYLWLSDSGSESASSLQVAPSADGVRATWTLRF